MMTTNLKGNDMGTKAINQKMAAKIGLPKLELRQRKTTAGKIEIDIYVWRSMVCDELHKIIDDLGYEPVTMISNCRSITCQTPEEVDRARTPLARFFKSDGSFAS